MARGAISALGIVVEGCRADSHPLVSRFLEGDFNLRPTKPRHAETWDVKPVSQKIRHVDPLHSLSVKELTLKLVMLMAQTQVTRVQTLHLLLLKGISLGEDSISVVWGVILNNPDPSSTFRWLGFMLIHKMQGCVMS